MNSAMGTISAFPPVLILSLLQTWDSPEVFSAIVPGLENSNFFFTEIPHVRSVSTEQAAQNELFLIWPD